MIDYRQKHTAGWLQHFAHRGHRAARPLAAGVEGAVYWLEEGLVAKVWSGRPPADLGLTRQVYADLARHRLPFSTPPPSWVTRRRRWRCTSAPTP